MKLITPISDLGWLGKQVAKRLEKVNLKTVQDLLFYFPRTYEDFSHIAAMATVAINQTATVRGTIRAMATKRTPRRRLLITEAFIEDETGGLKAVWFNSPYLAQSLHIGDEIILAGRLMHSRWGMAMEHPTWEKATGADSIHTGRLVPVYSTVGSVTSKQIRSLVAECREVIPAVAETLPEATRTRHKLIPIAEAIQSIHFPANMSEADAARQRFGFEELLTLHLKNLQQRQRRQKNQAPHITIDLETIKAFVARLPFKLTNAQRKVAWDILQDISSAVPHTQSPPVSTLSPITYPLNPIPPMARILIGDVGSGKTLVGAIALLAVVQAGWQAVLMAPTEILAQQHFTTISSLIFNFQFPISKQDPNQKKQIKVALLTSSTKEKSKIKKAIVEGEVGIVIGTHALLQEKITIPRLALVIVDEQHRFGVAQRATLMQKITNNPSRNDRFGNWKLEIGNSQVVPHFLSMTATPIPRTLGLTFFGDLDASWLDQMPPNRKAVKTFVVPPQKRIGAYDFIRREVAAGHQVFVVCPLIDPSDTLGVASATEEYERLKRDIFPHLRVGLLHGRLPTKEKEAIRQHLLNGTVDILVSTTVVEVGVDVPNATVMMIEGAERFGLATLWQLHGRVGRAQHASWCFLFTESNDPKVLERLQRVARAKSGFELAEYDLKERGPGALSGVEQSGWFNALRFADPTDTTLIALTHKEATKIIVRDPELVHIPAGLKTKLTEEVIVSHPE